MTIASFSNTTLVDTEQIELECIGNGYPEPTVQVTIYTYDSYNVSPHT